MIVIRRFLAAVRVVLTNPLFLVLSIILYALLLASLYIFVSTREATMVQLLITYFFLLLIPAEFFILQATILTRAQDAKWHWRAIFINAVKLFVVTIPIVIIGYVVWILLNKWQLHYPAPRAPIVFPPATAKPQPVHWPGLLFATVRGLLFVVLLPLATIHLWIEVTTHDVRSLFSGGAVASIKRLGQVIARSFSSSSVFIYALGLVLFALIPYFLLVIHPSPKGTKTDFAVFVGRLLLVFAFTLSGWVVTLLALGRRNDGAESMTPAPAAVPAEAAA
jgi:hypothetical protein